jgi:hypothetical protein
MSSLGELVEESKKHRVVLKNKKGKPLIDISLLLALILSVGAPQLLLVVLICMAFDMIDVEYDGREVGLDGVG